MPCTREQVIRLYKEQHERVLEPLGKKVKLKFNRNKTRAAVCFFDPVEIGISENYFKSESITEKDVINTILHEMAHAIAGHAAGHGKEWKRIAKSIGCDAQRCTKRFMEESQYKHILKCGHGCIIKRHKLSRNKVYVCKKHKLMLKK